MAFGAFVAAATLLALAPIEQSQAQLFINIFPSNDNTNHTLWVFSGSSSAWRHSNLPAEIRTTGNANYDQQDTTKTRGGLLKDGSGHQEYTLTALSSTNTPNDLEYMTYWAGKTINWGTTNTNDDIAFLSSATNAPMLTLGSNSRPLAAMLLRDVPRTDRDDIGPRLGGSGVFKYSENSGSPMAISWTGAGVMNKPISAFHIDTPGNYKGHRDLNSGAILGGWHAWRQDTGLRIRVHSAIPEPEEYALVFALFALGFVFFRRHFQKKKRQAATS